MIKTNHKNIRSLVGGAIILMSAFTVSVAQTLINDNGYTDTSKYQNVQNTGAFSLSGTSIKLINKNVTLYRVFDDGFSITLGELNSGDSLSMSFNCAYENLPANAELSFGFVNYTGTVTTSNNVIHVYDRPGTVYDSTFRYRNNNVNLTDWDATAVGTKWFDNKETPNLKDTQAHTVTFTVTAGDIIGTDHYYTLGYYLDGTTITEQSNLLLNTQINYAITGVALRTGDDGNFYLNNLSVTHFAIPEPSAIVLLGLGAGLLVVTTALRRRR
ncbi:MAG: PEP-CTERM sorting domain-containing protein [Verrucomicrobiales bacterium]|nr:PEP-CTERM sorting domain-containing protein [Verrucomicrobiales bacterium]